VKALSFIAIGALFSTGLVLSGMTQPERIIGFLDVSGDFDPTLLWVMVGAVLTHGISYRWIMKRPAPFFAPSFEIPENKPLDARLIVGSALFGVGWGLAGYCPGPALTSVFTFDTETLTFVAGMILGMVLFAARQLARGRPPHAAVSSWAQADSRSHCSPT
jgi:uncharacterized membrane protein YedE/YeeE